MLERFKRERLEQEAKEKMEYDLYIEMMEDKGISQAERIEESLVKYEQQVLDHSQS